MPGTLPGIVSFKVVVPRSNAVLLWWMSGNMPGTRPALPGNQIDHVRVSG